MIVPRKQYKEKYASELLVFINKTDTKGVITNFTKVDETFGVLSCYIYSIIDKYCSLESEFNGLKQVKKIAYETAYELMCLVNCYLL